MDARSDEKRTPMTNTGTFSVTTPTDREIVMTRNFDAPRSLVFEAWTKAEHVTHWWDPSGAPLSVCEIDLRPNGAFRWVHGGAGGGAYSFTGTYREITSPERLVFATRMFPSSPESVGTLVFTEENGKTKLMMTIECDSIEDRDALLKMRVDAGTARTLQNLAEYLDKIT
jgi:uncharacterized protein YndB with AHSA1/START domain